MPCPAAKLARSGGRRWLPVRKRLKSKLRRAQLAKFLNESGAALAVRNQCGLSTGERRPGVGWGIPPREAPLLQEKTSAHDATHVGRAPAELAR